jgi:hypothetical protein
MPTIIQGKQSRTHILSMHMAVLVKRGNIIETATNRIGSRSKGSGYSDITIHAERAVVKKLGDVSKLRGCTMYVWRIGFSGFYPMTSDPCHDCQIFLTKCIKQYGLRAVYYTNTNTPSQLMVTPKEHHKRPPTKKEEKGKQPMRYAHIQKPLTKQI